MGVPYVAVASLNDIFHDGKPLENNSKNMVDQPTEKRQAKFVVGNPYAFTKSREILGNIIVEDMKTSGGMDVDWLVERKGNFIILEIKTFHDDRIRIPLGQIIAYQNLHEKLNSDSKCYLFVLGVDENDFTNDKSKVWMFEMNEWKANTIPHISSSFGNTKNGFLVERSFMHEMTVHDLRAILESAWEEFGR